MMKHEIICISTYKCHLRQFLEFTIRSKKDIINEVDRKAFGNIACLTVFVVTTFRMR